MPHHPNRSRMLGLTALLCAGGVSPARALDFDEVHQPFVNLLEQELEYQVLSLQDQPGGERRTYQKLGYGRSLSDRWFAELAATWLNDSELGGEPVAVEAEVKWQLTEQGEYALDWGLLLELERDRATDSWEFGAAVLLTREWSHWVATANLRMELDEAEQTEPEAAMAAQARYRYRQQLEPAVELYLGEAYQMAGPMLTGNVKLGEGRSLRWTGGILSGLDSNSPDHTFKFRLELEF